jgi:hypothetical protein
MLVFVSLFAAVVASSRIAAAQGAKRKAAKPAARTASTGLSSQEGAALKLAFANLERGYADLLSTPPEVKGDTSKLEGHLRSAMEALHDLDPSAVPPTPANIAVQDKGHTREFILDAVSGHLEKAKRVIAGAGVSNPHFQQALQNIAVAATDVTEIRQTPAKK